MRIVLQRSTASLLAILLLLAGCVASDAGERHPARPAAEHVAEWVEVMRVEHPLKGERFVLLLRPDEDAAAGLRLLVRCRVLTARPGLPPNARLSVQARDAGGRVYPGLNADHELAGLDAFVRGGAGHEGSSLLFRFGPELTPARLGELSLTVDQVVLTCPLPLRSPR